MTLTSDKELSVEQSKLVAATIREELARRRMSRQHLADQARLSISTLEKALAYDPANDLGEEYHGLSAPDACARCVEHGVWGTLPFLVLFQFGFRLRVAGTNRVHAQCGETVSPKDDVRHLVALVV